MQRPGHGTAIRAEIAAAVREARRGRAKKGSATARSLQRAWQAPRNGGNAIREDADVCGWNARPIGLPKSCCGAPQYPGHPGAQEKQIEPAKPDLDTHKVRAAIAFLGRQHPLPTGPRGEILSDDGILAWFGLDVRLNAAERAAVQLRLREMVEVQKHLELIRLGMAPHSGPLPTYREEARRIRRRVSR